MMEFFTFVFSGFWVWLGFLILLCVTLSGAAELVKAFRRNRTVELRRIGDSCTVKITNASQGDADAAIYSPGTLESMEADYESI